MPDVEEINPEYQKGFNEGYLLAKHEPELAEQVSKVMPDTERGIGFKNGVAEFSKEVDVNKLPIWLRKVRTVSKDNPSISQSKRLDKDKDFEKE